MGTDLVTHGFTATKRSIQSIHDADESIQSMTTAVAAYLKGRSDEDLTALLDQVAEYVAEIESVEVESGRELLTEGAGVYAQIVHARHRMSEGWTVGTDAVFHVAGGSSFGDDPFEGWTELGAFLAACAEDRVLASLVGFISWGVGLPKAEA